MLPNKSYKNILTCLCVKLSFIDKSSHIKSMFHSMCSFGWSAEIIIGLSPCGLRTHGVCPPGLSTVYVCRVKKTTLKRTDF